MKIYVLQETGSTNTEAKDRDKYGNGDIIVAINQTAGRGQRGRQWNSRPGESLTFSLILEPDEFPAAYQFLISETAALAVADTLEGYGISPRIKWTNDIYVGDNKICGILIENELKASYVERSIVGIGINVNQREFPEWVPNPASLVIETGRTTDIMDVLERFCGCFEKRYEYLTGNMDSLAPETQNAYNASLYRLNEEYRYLIPGEGEIRGIIRKVLPAGDLEVETGGQTRKFQFKEIEFIL